MMKMERIAGQKKSDWEIVEFDRDTIKFSQKIQASIHRCLQKCGGSFNKFQQIGLTFLLIYISFVDCVTHYSSAF